MVLRDLSSYAIPINATKLYAGMVDNAKLNNQYLIISRDNLTFGGQSGVTHKSTTFEHKETSKCIFVITEQCYKVVNLEVFTTPDMSNRPTPSLFT